MGNRGKREMGRTRGNSISAGKVFFIVVAIAFLAIAGIFYYSVLKTNMLPTKYVIILSSVIGIFSLLIVIGLVKTHKTIKLNVFCTIVAILISSVCVVGNHYIDTTMKFLSKALTNVAEVEQFYVVVKKDSNYDKIEDIKGKKVYQFQIDKDIQGKVESKVDITIKEGEELTEVGKMLLDKKADAIIVSSAQYDMLDDEIEGYKNNTKVIYTESRQIEKVSIKDENSKYKIENGKFNIYISGIDTYGSINKVSRSDVNMIATVDMKTHQVLLTSIPRDYYVTLHSKKAKDKLTHSGIYGINETVKTVEDFMNIDINYYVRVNFSTLEKVVDAIGGIDVQSDYSFSTVGYSFKKGTNHMNGKEALAFSRERHSFKDGDNQRVKDQQKVLEAIIKKVSSSSTILKNYSNLLNSLSGSFNTNIEQKDISALVKSQLDTMPSWKTLNQSLEGSNSMNTTYSMGKQKLYVMVPNENSVSNCSKKINDMLGK